MPQPSHAPALPTLPDDAGLRARAAEDPEGLYELAVLVSRATAHTGSAPLGRIAVALCSDPSPAAVVCAARLADTLLSLDGPEYHRALVRRMAWHLVRPPGTTPLHSLFEQLPERLDTAAEFRACLLQEIALRSWGPWDEPYLAYAGRLRELGHPLAWLPLPALAFEDRARRLSHHRNRRSGALTPQELRGRYPEIPPTDAGARAARGAREVADPRRAERTGEPLTPFESWEARFYELPEPLPAADWNAALLTGLPADCLAGLTPDTLAAAHTTADDVLAALFLATFAGGIQSLGQEGAYARLAAWRGLYALLDLDRDVPHTDAVRHAAEHRWLRFAVAEGTDNGWFVGGYTEYGFGCAELGFAALDPTGRRIALLAATDTDTDMH
ncbi:DUF6183 family protein [Streptomyces sp. NPDC001922]|uniref:DUF6183 family protein n=1 Tax=Streptomyces sp. NPDC001922 TaxID=3364624 RepID=UPI0036932D81